MALPFAFERLPAGDAILTRLQSSLQRTLDSVTRVCLTGGLTISDNWAAQIVTLTAVTIPDPWVALTMAGSWARHADTAFEAPALRKDINGRVHARGLIAYVGAPAGDTMWTAPAAYCPAGSQILGNGSTFQWRVNSAGTATYESGDAGTFSLCGWSWDASDKRPVAMGSPFPSTVALSEHFKGTPSLFWPLSAVESGGGSVGAWWPDCAATMAGSRKAVQVKAVHGLAPGKTYTLSFLAMAS
jgi:hypothetical protein